MKLVVFLVLLFSIASVSALGDGTCEKWGYDSDYCCYDWYGGSYEECFGCVGENCESVEEIINETTVKSSTCNLVRSKILSPSEIYDTERRQFYTPVYSLESTESSFKTSNGLKSYNLIGAGWEIENNGSKDYLEYTLREFNDPDFLAVEVLKQISTNSLCEIRELNFQGLNTNHWTSFYGVICPYLSEGESLQSYESFNQVLFWADEDVLVSMSVHNSIDASEDDLKKVQKELLDAYFSRGGESLGIELSQEDLSYPIDYFLESDFSSCSSDLDYNFFWGCEIKPVLCGSKVVQDERCVDFTSGRKSEREISCLVDECSGCDVGELIEGSKKNQCVGKGEKFVVDSGEIMYCGFDKVVYPQKIVGEGDKKVICFNDFECEFNVCSSGSCVNMDLVKDSMNPFKKLFAKIGCGFSVFFEKVSSSERCLYEKSL